MKIAQKSAEKYWSKSTDIALKETCWKRYMKTGILQKLAVFNLWNRHDWCFETPPGLTASNMKAL